MTEWLKIFLFLNKPPVLPFFFQNNNVIPIHTYKRTIDKYTFILIFNVQLIIYNFTPKLSYIFFSFDISFYNLVKECLTYKVCTE